MHFQQQYGDYVLELETPRSFWTVRMAGSTIELGRFNVKSEALAAIKRYQAADKRRA